MKKIGDMNYYINGYNMITYGKIISWEVSYTGTVYKMLSKDGCVDYPTFTTPSASTIKREIESIIEDGLEKLEEQFRKDKNKNENN